MKISRKIVEFDYYNPSAIPISVGAGAGVGEEGAGAGIDFTTEEEVEVKFTVVGFFSPGFSGALLDNANDDPLILTEFFNLLISKLKFLRFC